MNRSGTLLSGVAAAVALSTKADAFALILRGDSVVRHVALTPGGPMSVRLPTLDGCTSPVNIAAGDLNGDAERDLLVFDSSCPNWVALSSNGRLHAEPWEASLPPLPANHFLEYEDLDGDASNELVGMNATGLMGYRFEAEGHIAFSASFAGPPYSNASLVNRILMAGSPLGERRLVFVRGSTLSLLSASPLAGALSVVGELQPVPGELLKPYQGLDQLQPLQEAGCEQFAIGIGFFVSDTSFPRHLVALKALSTESYSATRIPTLHADVIAYTSLDLGSESYLGVISKESDEYSFELLRRVGCDTFERAARLDGIAFHREATDGLVDLRTGEHLLGGSDETEARVVHFTSQWLDVIRVTGAGDAWELSSDAWDMSN